MSNARTDVRTDGLTNEVVPPSDISPVRYAREGRMGDRERDRVLMQADRHVYRCPGCGDWRYRYRIGRWHRTQPVCAVCGQP